MNETIVERHNSIVKPDDVVYCLGDCVMNDLERGLQYMQRLNGHKIIMIGNHDTPNKIAHYNMLNDCTCQDYATMVKFGKRYFYLSHYPAIVGNFDEDYGSWALHGHTHSTDRFEYFNYRAYNVGMDAHNCYPVSLEQIKQDIRERKNNSNEN